MEFTDHVTFVDVAGERVSVRVAADALHLFWGAGIGPQDAAGLVEENSDTIGTITREKIAANDREDGEIVIRAMDIEG